MQNWLEIFTLVTGLLFLVLEIRQSNWMWAVQMLTGIASVILFFRQGLYASMALNLYYLGSAVWGIISWRKDEGTAGDASSAIHLRKISVGTVALSLVLQVVGTAALLWALKALNDPMSGLDAGITVLSLIATWWLVRTYKEQWILWIVADLLYVVMCCSQEMFFMAGLYAFYTISAVYGFFHWTRNGKYIA